MLVSNLESPRSGKPVANQFVIVHEGKEYFQSYQTLIAYKDSAQITISEDWNYSVTTNKYFGQWIRSWGLDHSLDEIRKWLKSAKVGDRYDLGPYQILYVRSF